MHAWHNLLPIPAKSTGEFRASIHDPMQVVSGIVGRERIHYTAPPAKQVPELMQMLLHIINQSQPTMTKACLTHLIFLSIHPYQDGNRRMSRAINEMLLIQAGIIPLIKGLPTISLSNQIEWHRETYYQILESVQTGYQPAERWFEFWCTMLVDAFHYTMEQYAYLKDRALFIHQLPHPINLRQILMLNKIFDGFVGHITTQKWCTLTHTSPATAKRDIQEFEAMELLQAVGNRRGTHYIIGPSLGLHSRDINRAKLKGLHPKHRGHIMRKDGTESDPPLIAEISEIVQKRLCTPLKNTSAEFLHLKNELVKPLGITLAQYTIMFPLAAGVNTGAQLARFNFITPQSVNTLLNTLESKKLITRRTSPDHMQVNLIELTDKGREIVKLADEKIDAVERAIENSLTPEENCNLRATLAKIEAELQRLGKESAGNKI